MRTDKWQQTENDRSLCSSNLRVGVCLHLEQRQSLRRAKYTHTKKQIKIAAEKRDRLDDSRRKRQHGDELQNDVGSESWENEEKPSGEK